MIVKLVFVLIYIRHVVFLILRVTFLETLRLKCNQISYLSVCSNGWLQNMCDSRVIVFEYVYYYDCLDGVFHFFFIVFYRVRYIRFFIVSVLICVGFLY